MTPARLPAYVPHGIVMAHPALRLTANPFMAKPPPSANRALFEDDYVLSTLGRIGHDPYTALTELVANSWDAGAFRVQVVVPDALEGTLTVEDDGTGLTEAQFRKRWMTLGYKRHREQGDKVEFPEARSSHRRLAFGRNGRGRHGLLCFSDHYNVETHRAGKCSEFTIGTRNQESPFFIERFESHRAPGHGTRLKVTVQHRLPKPDDLRDMLAARFLHDPQFTVEVNGVAVPLEEHRGLIQTEVLTVEPGFDVSASVVDASEPGRLARYQGVAFWVNKRLVGLPAWSVGNTAVLDGRSRFAKRYALVIQGAAVWGDDVEADWSGFKKTPRTDKLFEAVRGYAQDVIQRLSADMVEAQSEDALFRNREEFRGLPMAAKLEVAQFTQQLVQEQPAVHTETLAKAVKSVIHILAARSGQSFLDRLLTLDENDIDGLDQMLSKWSVQDALIVLDEIDRRLSVVAALEKLSGDAGADELHTLHPLTTQARWLFGPEFESAEYASNRSLRTVALELFNAPVDQQTFYNPAKRPDLVVLPDRTLCLVGTEHFDSSGPNLVTLGNVLLIELKRGRSTIGLAEMTQAYAYVQELINSGGLEGSPFFHAFVVGHTVAPVARQGMEIPGRARITPTSYGQLTLTANRRLHGLKARTPARYEDVSGYDLTRRVMETPSQAAESLPQAPAEK